MEQLILFLLVALASIVSTYLQKKKREAEERESGNLPEPPPYAPTPGHRPVGHPGRSVDWQEELRKILQGETTPPKPPPVAPSKTVPPPAVPKPARSIPKRPAPVTVTVEKSEGALVLPSPLKQSATAYTRASQLQEKVGARLEAVNERTRMHRPTPVTQRQAGRGFTIARRWTRNPESMREAFIASLIFAPPPGLGPNEPAGRIY